MTKTLFSEGGLPRQLAPTTTTKLAQRMILGAQIVAEHFPEGVGTSPALQILLALYVAEEDAHYLSTGELTPAGSRSTTVTERWVAYLVQLGLVDRRDDVLALSADGHATMTDAIEAMLVAQRALD